MNTDFLKKEGALAKHGNKAFNCLSGGAIVWLFATFATKSDLARVDARCDKCEEKRAAQWRKLMDHEVALAKAGVHVVSSEWTNDKVSDAR